ncbi:hypothetical protein DL98DRAFT_85483 [Cadophora sp. DSE1049]|nr:hypothetical protein DL98DRAFT_85483 [Cadophora sp. DSE1049]
MATVGGSRELAPFSATAYSETEDFVSDRQVTLFPALIALGDESGLRHHIPAVIEAVQVGKWVDLKPQSNVIKQGWGVLKVGEASQRPRLWVELQGIDIGCLWGNTQCNVFHSLQNQRAILCFICHFASLPCELVVYPFRKKTFVASTMLVICREQGLLVFCSHFRVPTIIYNVSASLITRFVGIHTMQQDLYET